MSQVSPSRQRRLPPRHRRALILEVARDRIAEVGIAHTTLRDVAARCGLSTGTVTYHFSCLADMLSEALAVASEEFITRVLAEVDERGSAIERLSFIADANLPDRPDALALWGMWLDYWSIAARGGDKEREMHAMRYARWRGVCESVLEDAIASREIAPVDVAQVASEFVGLVDGLALQAIVGDAESVTRVRSVLNSYLVRTLRPPTAKPRSPARPKKAASRAS